MRKQKGLTPNDPGIKIPKIRKFPTPTSSQTKSTSQTPNSSQIIDPVPNDLDQWLHIWNHAKKNQIPLSHDHVKVAQRKNEIAQANREIERQAKIINKIEEEHEQMAKYIEEKCEARVAIIERQNLATDLASLIKENTIQIIHTQEHCEESRQYLTELYNNVASKQEETIENLNQVFNDQVSLKTTELENLLELKSNELLTLHTECEKIEEELKQKALVEVAMNSKVEELELPIDNIGKNYNTESVEISKIIKKNDAILKIEQEAIQILEAENNKISIKYNELLSRYEASQIPNPEYTKEIQFLQFAEQELNEKVISLNNELEELKNNYSESVKNKDLESAEHRNQLQDLKTAYMKATDELKNAILSDEELMKTATNVVKNYEILQNELEKKDDKIASRRINLGDVLGKNKEWNDKIQLQNRESIEVEKEIGENTAGFKSREAKRDAEVKKKVQLSGEIVSIKEQLSHEYREFEELLEQQINERVHSTKEAEEIKKEMKQKDNVIAKEQRIDKDVRKEIERKRLEYKKKIQDATNSSKQCQLSGHEKQIKELDIKINDLNRELSNEKLKYKQADEQRNTNEAREKEKYESQVKKLQSNYDEVKKELSSIEQENKKLLAELDEAEALIETTTLEPKMITVKSPLKPILKSAAKESPLKPQKVQFDLGPSSTQDCINISEMFEAAEHRYATSAVNNRPDWANIQISMTPEEPDTTQSQPTTQVRKFFKHSRPGQKLIPRSGKK